MKTSSSSIAAKLSSVANRTFNNVMVAMGTLSFIWILAFLMVAMFGK